MGCLEFYLWLFEPILRYLEIPPNRSRCAPASPSCHILEPILGSKIHECLCSKTPCSILCHAEPSWNHLNSYVAILKDFGFYWSNFEAILDYLGPTCLRAVIDVLWINLELFWLSRSHFGPSQAHLGTKKFQNIFQI